MDSDGLRIRGDEDDANGECHRARYRWAASMLEPGSRVLDYGCGTGYGTEILRAVGMQADGYDPLVPPFDGPFATRYDAVVCFEVLEHLHEPPLATLMALEKLAPIVIASVPYMEAIGNNPHHRWFRLQEASFPGRWFAYQMADSTISALAGDGAQNLIVCSFKVER